MTGNFLIWGISILFVSLNASLTLAQEMTSYNADDARAAWPCILKLTAKHYRPGLHTDNLPPPRIVLKYEVSIVDFQAAASDQMGIVPQQVTNIFVTNTNTIYLVSEYNTKQYGRTVFDSLAHEATHYLQFHVDKTEATQMTENDEDIAVRIQTEIREQYAAQIQNGQFICPN